MHICICVLPTLYPQPLPTLQNLPFVTWADNPLFFVLQVQLYIEVLLYWRIEAEFEHLNIWRIIVIIYKFQASCGTSTPRPEPGNKPLKLKAFVSFQPIGRTNRRISLKRRFSLRYRICPFVCFFVTIFFNLFDNLD